MKRVLITGGTGFFGKSILDFYRRHICDYQFTVLSRHGLSPDFLKTLGDFAVKELHGDVRSFDIGDERFDYLIHAATPARADICDAEMRSIILDGTQNMLQQAKKCCAKKFMMVSSGGVYGQGWSRPIKEDDIPQPYTAYGIAKLEAERIAVASGLCTLLPRCFAFVGPHLSRDAHFAIGNFIGDVLAGKPIIIKGDGSPMRSYMFADDLVEWLMAILERGESGRIYHVGSPEAISIRNLAELVNEVLNGKSVINVLGKTVSGAANYYVPNVERTQRELNLHLTVNIADAIRKSV